MHENYFTPQIKPKTINGKLSLAFTSAFARLFPTKSADFALKHLFKPYSRRSYSFRTKVRPLETLKVPTHLGLVSLHHFKGAQSASSEESVLLTHGWADTSVRFTQLIDHLVDNGFDVWALDHYGHGLSDGNTSHLFAFVNGITESIKKIESSGTKLTGLIGHSMGAAASLNLDVEKLKNKKVILVAAPTHFFENLFKNTKKRGVSNHLLLNSLNRLSALFQKDWVELSPAKNAHKIGDNFLIIHDKKDDVCSHDNFKKIVGSKAHEFYSTEGLGHLKILKDNKVHKKISEFLKV